MDNILEIIKRGKVEALTGHLNGIDKTNSIKFTHEPEKNGQIPFLDTLITRREDGSIKLLVYRIATQTMTSSFLLFRVVDRIWRP